MPPESGRRFRVKDMRENKGLKRAVRIWKIATLFRRTPPLGAGAACCGAAPLRGASLTECARKRVSARRLVAAEEADPFACGY
jgi:hypothetical protein